MRMTHPRKSVRTLLFGALVITVACTDTVSPIGPDNQLNVTNEIDQFELGVVNLDEVTETQRFDWENTGTQATIDVNQSITDGSAILTVRDADGTVLYQEDVAQDSDGNTPEGVPGTWEIEIVFDETSGTFNFSVERTD